MTSKLQWISSHRWLLFVLVGLSWSVGFNIWFLSLSLRKPSEPVETNPYERGIAFQGVIDARARIRALQWHLSSFVSAPIDGDSREVTLKVADASGAPVSKLIVRLEASRPASAALDQELSLIESDVRGTYSANGVFASGLWHFRWVSRVGDDAILFEEQVTVPG